MRVEMIQNVWQERFHGKIIFWDLQTCWQFCTSFTSTDVAHSLVELGTCSSPPIYDIIFKTIWAWINAVFFIISVTQLWSSSSEVNHLGSRTVRQALETENILLQASKTWFPCFFNFCTMLYQFRQCFLIRMYENPKQMIASLHLEAVPFFKRSRVDNSSAPWNRTKAFTPSYANFSLSSTSHSFSSFTNFSLPSITSIFVITQNIEALNRTYHHHYQALSASPRCCGGHPYNLSGTGSTLCYPVHLNSSLCRKDLRARRLQTLPAVVRYLPCPTI